MGASPLFFNMTGLPYLILAVVLMMAWIVVEAILLYRVHIKSIKRIKNNERR
jgi:hypothetical protein